MTAKLALRPIQDVIVMDGVTGEHILKVRTELRMRGISRSRPSDAFTGAQLGLPQRTLTRLRERVYDYMEAIKTLDNVPDHIGSLITVGALDRRVWGRMQAYTQEETLSGVFEKRMQLSLRAQDIYQVLKDMQACGFQEDRKGWHAFCAALVHPYRGAQGPRVLARLGDLVHHAVPVDADGGLIAVREKLCLSSDTYAAWAVILAFRLQHVDLRDPRLADADFAQAYNSRYMVGLSDALARDMFTGEGFRRFCCDPHRQAELARREGHSVFVPAVGPVMA